MSDTKEIIIYAFHGCGQNSDVFSRLLKGLKLKQHSEYRMICRNGFYKIDQGFSWYAGVNHDDPAVYHKPCPHKFMDQLYHEMCRLNKPIMLIGFSQGAMFACDLAFRYRHTPIIKVVSIAPPYFDQWPMTDSTTIPLVLVTSDQDDCVSSRESQRWRARFPRGDDFTTDRGHKVHFPAALRNMIFSSQ